MSFEKIKDHKREEEVHIWATMMNQLIAFNKDCRIIYLLCYPKK